MPIPIFPDTLPVAGQRPNYSEQFPDLAIRTPMDVGEDKVRLGAPAGFRDQSVTLLLTSAQVAIFKAFYHEATRDGALPFEFPHQRTFETLLVYFKDKPRTGVAGGDIWLVSFEIESCDEVPPEPVAAIFLMEGLGVGSDASDFLMGGLG